MIVEILSEGTQALDRGLKKQIYQDVFRTPDSFWFDPETLELAGFHIVEGRYQPLTPDAQGRLHVRLPEGQVRFVSLSGGTLTPSTLVWSAGSAPIVLVRTFP